jgi:hypothetical protein
MSSLMRLSALRLFELTERRFALVRDGCFLALTVVLPVATIIVLRGRESGQSAAAPDAGEWREAGAWHGR